MSAGNGSFTFAPARDVRNLEDCFFYHTLDLPGLGQVQGYWDLRGQFDEYIGGVDLRGKTVLDIGTANGFLTFEAEKRGATDVVSFDIGDARYQHLMPFKDSPYYRNFEAWRAGANAMYEQWKNGYWLAHRLNQSEAKAFYGDIYELPTAAGSFDVVIIGSVLEHLSNPINALASAARLTKSTMIVVTDVVETEDRIAVFLGEPDRPEVPYNWWTYSLGTFRAIFKMLGFEIDSFTEHEYRCVLGGDTRRNTIVASRR